MASKTVANSESASAQLLARTDGRTNERSPHHTQTPHVLKRVRENDRIRITVELSARTWWRVSALAEAMGLPTDAYLAWTADEIAGGAQVETKPRNGRINRVGGPRYDQAWLESEVAKCHADRLNDQETSKRVGCSPETARRIRIRLGLNVNGARERRQQ